VVRAGLKARSLSPDARNAQFFEGALAPAARAKSVSSSRSTGAALAERLSPPVAPRQSAPAAATQADPPPREPVAAFFEDYWPHGRRRAPDGMIVAIAVTSTTDGSAGAGVPGIVAHWSRASR
jgi:hypothetical protein